MCIFNFIFELYKFELLLLALCFATKAMTMALDGVWRGVLEVGVYEVSAPHWHLFTESLYSQRLCFA